MTDAYEEARTPRWTLVACTILTLWVTSIAHAAECDSTSKGYPTLDSATASYLGQMCGLYPGGQNTPPASHDSAGKALAQSFVPLDSSGAPDSAGHWVLLSVGMSNTTQEFSTFVSNLAGDTTLHPRLRIVDGAQGGQTAARIKYDTAQFWTVVEARLASQGLSPAQVQAIWMKEANAGPTAAFPAHAAALRDDLAGVVRTTMQKFPNLRQLFASSRTYGGYASTALNPEPFAYESGFAVRWLIEDQLNGSPTLNPYPAQGPVEAPWLAWGPYLWADGETPRPSDSLQWFCADFGTDGTHPSPSGRQKVAAEVEEFFKTSPYTTPWFLAPAASPQMRGDVDGTGTITSADIVILVGVVFKGQVPGFPLELADVNCSGAPTSADIIYLVNYVFKAGTAPCGL